MSTILSRMEKIISKSKNIFEGPKYFFPPRKYFLKQHRFVRRHWLSPSPSLVGLRVSVVRQEKCRSMPAFETQLAATVGQISCLEILEYKIFFDRTSVTITYFWWISLSMRLNCPFIYFCLGKDIYLGKGSKKNLEFSRFSRWVGQGMLWH